MPDLRDRTPPPPAPVVVPAAPYLEYRVERHQDSWFIVYDGEEFGPYHSAREAMLFAIDVAYKLGERGRDTRVRLMDSTSQPCSSWTYGLDPYPPRL